MGLKMTCEAETVEACKRKRSSTGLLRVSRHFVQQVVSLCVLQAIKFLVPLQQSGRHLASQ
jgi:hypothetical protein